NFERFAAKSRSGLELRLQASKLNRGGFVPEHRVDIVLRDVIASAVEPRTVDEITVATRTAIVRPRLRITGQEPDHFCNSLPCQILKIAQFVDVRHLLLNVAGEF